MKTRFTIRQLIAYFVLLACGLFVVFTSGAQSIGEIIDSLALFLVITLTIFCVFYPFLLKRKLLKAFSDELTIVTTKIEAFPQRDVAALETISQELKELGFEPVQDFTWHNPAIKMVPNFVRFWLHESGSCYAESSQYFTNTAVLITLRFFSFFGDGPPHQSLLPTLRAPLPVPGAPDSGEWEKQAATHSIWTYSTTNAPPRTMIRVLRHPHYLSRYMEKTNARQMYEQHLADREKIAAHLQLPIAGELTFQRYFNWAILAHRAYRWQLRHQNIHLALLRAFFNKNETWWGELGQDLK